jgi:hypothetical protein
MKLSFDGRSATLQEVGTMVTRLTGADAGTIYVPNGYLMTAIVEERSRRRPDSGPPR